MIVNGPVEFTYPGDTLRSYNIQYTIYNIQYTIHNIEYRIYSVYINCDLIFPLLSPPAFGNHPKETPGPKNPGFFPAILINIWVKEMTFVDTFDHSVCLATSFLRNLQLLTNPFACKPLQLEKWSTSADQKLTKQNEIVDLLLFYIGQALNHWLVSLNNSIKIETSWGWAGPSSAPAVQSLDSIQWYVQHQMQ